METNDPLYVLSQIKSRVLVPKLILLIVLSVIFYLGILLNLSFLDLSAQEETTIKSVALFLLLLIIIVSAIITVHTAQRGYRFYQDHLEFGSISLPYEGIEKIEVKQGFLDKLFKTKEVSLGEKFSLKNISQEVDVQGYLEQLKEYTLRKQKPMP